MIEREFRSITVNQVGYPTEGMKTAVFTSMGGSFQIVNVASNEIVFHGETNAAIIDNASGKTVYQGDFSTLTTPGTYRISQDGTSAVFTIEDKPYQELHQSLLKAFYFFRCGMELDEKYAGPWKHNACHLTKGIVYGKPERILDSSGGWHDAGDYGKYTVAGAKAIADLLLAFELYPTAYDQPIPIPETDSITPDVLHECRYELEWLFKMQDPTNGGVFHKLTTLNFPDLDVMPEDDSADLYFSPISATATATFSAVMAMAARVYKEFDVGFADRCLNAAIYSWEWLTQHQNKTGFKNPSDINTGEYGDPDDRDERFWAAAELYRTTTHDDYHHALLTISKQDFNKYNLGWTEVGGYGTIAYLLNGETNTDKTLYSQLREGLIKTAIQLVSRSKNDGYMISLTEDDYIWGSNMIVMNNAMHLLLAYHFTNDPIFETCALEHIHYLLGRNVLDISFVTGFGDRPVMNLHHRPSVGDEVVDPVPGLVSGGPDKGLNDEYSREYLQGKPAAQAFIDHQESYSTNEVTIYWNSPAVFVLSHWAK